MCIIEGLLHSGGEVIPMTENGHLQVTCTYCESYPNTNVLKLF